MPEAVFEPRSSLQASCVWGPSCLVPPREATALTKWTQSKGQFSKLEQAAESTG